MKCPLCPQDITMEDQRDFSMRVCRNCYRKFSNEEQRAIEIAFKELDARMNSGDINYVLEAAATLCNLYINAILRLTKLSFN